MANITGRRDLFDSTLDIQDYSGRNFDADVLDTIVESSHHEMDQQVQSDDILDEDHWTDDSLAEMKVEEEF